MHPTNAPNGHPPAPRNLLNLYKEADRALDSRDDSAVREWLVLNGLAEEADILDGPAPDTSKDFNCPATGVKVVTACSLDECRYHVNYPYSQNCLLAYSQQQGTDHLNPEEISYLYGLPVDKVNKSLEKSMHSLRWGFLTAEAASDLDMQPRFKFVLTRKVCCVCACPTDAKRIDLKDMELAYCSRECMDEKNPLVVQLESRLGLRIDFILRWVLKRFRSVSLVEKALNMPRGMVQELCLKNLDRDLRHFFPESKDTSTPRRRVLCRLPRPSRPGERWGYQAVRAIESQSGPRKNLNSGSDPGWAALERKLLKITS